MKYALERLQDGKTRMVDAYGNPLGHGDVDSPVLHVLPKLFVPAEALPHPSRPFSGLERDNLSLHVTSTLPIDLAPEDGVVIRQPYPNRRYFVGGSTLIRNGWVVPLSLGDVDFDIEFRWVIEGPGVWRVLHQDEWEVRHLIHVKLHPGRGITYSMDSACWPDRDGQARHFSPVSLLGIEAEDPGEHAHRQIVRTSDLVYSDGELEGELAGYFLEERMDITGAPLDQAWTIGAFEEEQLHEVEQRAVFERDNEVHRANGPVELPAELFVQAVKLAEGIPFDNDSPFASEVRGVPGGMERHPAMKLLCAWWETVRPDGEPFKPGSAMPMIRVRDDGEYWWGHSEIPNVSIDGFNPSGRDMAHVGNLVLVLFQATQEIARFDEHGMHTFLPSGEPHSTVEITKGDFLDGASDEAWFCLNALATFRNRFPAAWDFLNKTGREYRKVRRAEVAQVVHLPESTKCCPNCNGMPVVTRDPTGESNLPFLLKCGDHVVISGDSLEEVLEVWSNDIDFPEMETDDRADGDPAK